MRIDIWSDVVCPWCYLGHRRFALAIQELGLDDIKVTWRAFQLDPDAPPDPTPLAPVIERKYGPGAFDAMVERLVVLGAQVGIEFRFDIAQRVNTGDAHQLLAWADEQHAGEEMRERLFAAYFTEGADLSDRTQLTAQAAAVGLSGAQAGIQLDSGAHVSSVAADMAAARSAGVTGVPAFLVNGEFLIPGAQEVDRLVALLGRIHRRETTGGS